MPTSKRSKLTVFIALALALLAAVLGAPAASAKPLPVPWDSRAALRGALTPNQAPPGANDWNCKTDAAHPFPVILVHGTLFTQATGFQAGSPFLKNNGYCVFTFNYGSPWWLANSPMQAVDDIPGGARELGAFVDKVRRVTKSDKVDLVGWSQGGGIMPNYYINVLNQGRKVHSLIGIAPSNHGTALSNLAFFRSLFPPLTRPIYDTITYLTPGLTQQAISDKMSDTVYGHGDTRPGINYTTIVTQFDEVVTPFPRQYLKGPNVTNITLQDDCDKDRADHLSTVYSKRTWLFVLNALSPSTAKPVPCLTVDPFWPGVK